MQTLIDEFKLNNATDQMKLIRSPLRICPLGAHVDHQGGLVTGMALDVSIDLAYTANDEGYVDLQSLDFPDKEYFHIDHVPDMIPGFWGELYSRSGGCVVAVT